MRILGIPNDKSMKRRRSAGDKKELLATRTGELAAALSLRSFGHSCCTVDLLSRAWGF